MGDITEVWGCCMGLDVGVVTIQYLERPQEPVYRFLNELLNEAAEGLEVEDDDDWVWEGSWEGNSLVEFSQDYLERRTIAWATNNNVGDDGRAVLANWVSALPWRDGMIMLHLNR